MPSARNADLVQEFLENLSDVVREPFLIVTLDLRILAASRVFYEVFPFEPEQIVGQAILEMGNGCWDTEQFREVVEALVLSSPGFQNLELAFDNPVLGKRTLLLNAQQVKWAFGHERVILVALEDITERRTIEAELERLEKIESLGILAGGIAHDFNNLMGGLMATCELIAHHLKAGRPEDALARIERVPGIFARGRALTQRLLTFSKGEKPVRAIQALGRFLPEWVDFALMGSDVTATVTIDPDLWECDCDIGQIGQVLNNLVINARQASPEGGCILVSASNLLTLGPNISIAVTNTGAPIPASNVEQIFHPFFTTKQHGTGLGLSIVASVIEKHGGRVEVSSDEERGTTFTVFLPATIARGTLDSGSSSCAELAGSGIALVMDDDTAVLDAVGELVAILGFEVYRCRSGAEVLRTYQNVLDQGRDVTLFLLDNQVQGGMGGVATAEHLRSLGSWAQIVIMSGHFDAPEAPLVSQTHRLWRLRKPFSSDELCTVLLPAVSPS